MSKENFKTVKTLIDELMLSVETKLEGEEVKLEVTYPELIEGAEVKEGEEIAPDGEYEVEDGIKIVVLDGKISEIIKPEVEEVVEPEVEMEAEVEITEEVILAEEEVIEPVVEVEEEIVVEDKPIVEDVLNVEGLSALINMPEMKDGFCSISFSVVDGKIAWGELYTSDYKMLMSKQTDTEKELNELKAKLEAKDNLILELGKEVDKKPLIQAPSEYKEVKLTRAEIIKETIRTNKK